MAEQSPRSCIDIGVSDIEAIPVGGYRNEDEACAPLSDFKPKIEISE